MGRRCRSCGRRVSSDAAWCSSCGGQVYSPLGRIGGLIVGAFLALVLAVLAVIIWSGRG